MFNDSKSCELSHIVLLPFVLCLPRDSVTSHGAGAPLAQQEVVMTEEQSDIALEDAVCLPLEWHRSPCTPAPQLALSTTPVCAAHHWISHQLCCTSAPATEQRLWCHTLQSWREGWGRSHLCSSQGLGMQVLSSAAKPFKEISASGHCCSVSQFVAIWGASVTGSWGHYSEIPLAKAPERLFSFVLIAIISLSTLFFP